jgi:hypothetical protein
MDTLVSLRLEKNENRRPEYQQAKGQKLSEKENIKFGEMKNK